MASKISLGEQLEQVRRQYIEHHPRSRDYLAAAAAVMPGANTRTAVFYRPFPLVISHGSGCMLWDIDGHRYVDFLGDFSAGLYGHTNRSIHAAVVAALNGGISLGAATPREALLAAALCQRIPSLERVRFTNSGSEANLMALWLARHVTGRPKVMVFEGSYHGSLLNFRNAPAVDGIFDVLIAPYNDLEQSAALLDEHASELAAVLVEPMLGGGCIPGHGEFLKMLRATCTRIGAVLVFDEVMTSRLHAGGLQAATGVRPDLTTLGKYLGGGNAFGAFGGRADLMEQFDPRRDGALAHAGTFNNNVITMAAGYAGLTEVYTPDQVSQLNARGDALRARLNALCGHAGVPLQFTGLGSLLNAHATSAPINSVRDLKGVNLQLQTLLHLFLIESGIYIAERGYMALSLAIGNSEVAKFEKAMGSLLGLLADTYY